MAMRTRIRQAQPSDTAAVISAGVAAQQSQIALIGRVPPSGRPEHYGPFVERNAVWVIEEGASVVGVIILEHVDDHLMILTIGVIPSRQGRGYGKRLMEFAEQRARELGLGEVRLFSNSLNKPAIAVFEHLGYTAFGTHPSRFPGHVLVDMAKRIDGA
jgi:ribosomal protein S18 acetylase RimI-like enzyme